MAILYSSLYGTPPNAAEDTAPIYRGPSGHMQVGSLYVVRGTVTIDDDIGASDSAKLCAVPQGTKLLRMAIVPSADLDGSNSFTFNLGWVSAATAFASASTGLQGTSAYTTAAADQASAAAAGDGDEVVLTRVAGALAAGTLTFVAEFSA